jgi:hypothetical protein
LFSYQRLLNKNQYNMPIEHPFLDAALVGGAGLGAYELYHHHQYGNFGFGNPYNGGFGGGYGGGYGGPYGYGSPYGYSGFY